MANGPHTREEIIKSVDKGLYAESFTNGQVYIGAGDFTFYVKSGRMIENGKLTAPVKDINIIGNGPEVLRDIEMVADDLELAEGGWQLRQRRAVRSGFAGPADGKGQENHDRFGRLKGPVMDAMTKPDVRKTI